MARRLDPMSGKDVEPTVSTVDDSSVARSTARAFAAALSALLVASLVVSRSNDALSTDGTIAGSVVSAGTISLVDDDQGRALFDLEDVAPGRPADRCIEVVYEGSILPVDLDMRAAASGPLAEFLDVTVEAGSGGGFDSCDGFVAEASVFAGTLAGLVGEEWVSLGRIVNTGDRATYRVRFAVQDRQEALGLTTNADFTWEATPS